MIRSFFVLIVLSPAAFAADLNQVFSNTLVLGASVSRGFAAPGPGTIAAKRHKGRVKIIAEDEKPGASYGIFTPQSLAGYSSVIAVDFLFWDTATWFLNGPTYKSLNSLIASAEANKIPLVLGDVPNLVGWLAQPSRNTINAYLESVCLAERNCFIVPFVDLHEQAMETGILIGTKTYTFEQLMADDELHLNPTGSQHISGMIIKLLQGQKL